MNDIDKQIDLLNNPARRRKTLRQHMVDFIEGSWSVKLSEITTKYQRFDRDARMDVLRQLVNERLISVELVRGATGAPATVIMWIGGVPE